jgi:hypothetical protein
VLIGVIVKASPFTHWFKVSIFFIWILVDIEGSGRPTMATKKKRLAEWRSEVPRIGLIFYECQILPPNLNRSVSVVQTLQISLL